MDAASDRKTYLITGATSGIGEATATELARRGHRVLLGSRSVEHAEEALARIRGQVPNALLEPMVGDLAELSQVVNLGRKVSTATDRIDGLILNAGVSIPRHELTRDGLEVNFATNHLAGFLLTGLLMPLLERSDQGRVVTLSSAFHRHVKALDVEALATGTGIEPDKRYEATKLLNVLFALELARRFRGTPLTANVADPGFVHTRLGRYTRGPFGLMLKLTRPMQDSPEKASRTVVHLATSPDLAAVSGRYFPGTTPVEPSPLAQDPELARGLWELSSRLLRERGMPAPGDPR